MIRQIDKLQYNYQQNRLIAVTDLNADPKGFTDVNTNQDYNRSYNLTI